jgi:hypothetical protein
MQERTPGLALVDIEILDSELEAKVKLLSKIND